MITVGGRTIRCEIYTLINSIWNKEDLQRSGSCRSFHLFIRWVIKKILVLKEHNTFVKYMHNFIQNPAVKFKSICRENYREKSVWVSTQQDNY